MIILLIRRTCLISLMLAVFGDVALPQSIAGLEHWMPTWAASPQPLPVPAQPPLGQTPPPPRVDRSFNNQTIRMVVHTSIAGHRVRVQLSNAYGATPLRVSKVNGEVSSVQRISISADGKTYTSTQTRERGQAVHDVIVFERQ